MACYEDSFTFIYVDDVRTSQETHLWAFTACYGDSFTFYLLCSIRWVYILQYLAEGKISSFTRLNKKISFMTDQLPV
jgi:hypothetical protein